MDTRYKLDARGRARGAVQPVWIAVVAVIAVLVVAAWLLILKPHQEQILADAGGHPSTPVSTTKRAAPPPVNVESMGVNELLSEARKAVNEQRLLAPAGNNAFEFYLRVLEKQPGNQVAADALRETFPFAASAAEQVINQSDFIEAQREIDLLAKADPANYTLTILRSKLDAQRKLLDKQQQQELEQKKAALLAEQKAAADKVAAAKQAELEAAQLAAQQRAAEQAAQQQSEQSEQESVAAASGDDSARGVNKDAALIKAAAPDYPPSAMRAQREGWVVVAFTIKPDGHTSDVHVVDAQPRHIFDRAAREAVNRYRFSPAIKDGKPVASKRQQRIVFKLK